MQVQFNQIFDTKTNTDDRQLAIYNQMRESTFQIATYVGCDGHKRAVVNLLPRSHHGIGVAEISLSMVVKDFSRRLWKAVNQNLRLAQVLLEGAQYFLGFAKPTMPRRQPEVRYWRTFIHGLPLS